MVSTSGEHSTTTELERAGHGEAAEYIPNPDERPGENWGWHGRFPRARQAAGWGTLAFLMGNIWAHYDGIEIEDVILILLGVWLVVMLVRDARAQLAARRR